MTASYSFPDIYFMDLKSLPVRFVERKLKAIATRYAKSNNLHFRDGLQAVAEHYGFPNWDELIQKLREKEAVAA